MGTIFIAGVYTIIYTYSRVTYFAFAVVIIFYALIMVRGWLRYLAIPALLLTVVFVGYTSPQVNSRMSHAYDELTEYITLSKSGERVTTEISSSVGTRLEMWRATPLILRDHAIIGVGNGNYNNIMQDYIENKELNPVVGRHSHAHNVFVNVLILKGILGFLITCAVLFFPLYVYIRTYKQSRETAATGIAFLVIIIMYSFNETAPFVKSNFVATFLLISAVLFQNHMHKIKNQ